MEVTLEAGVSVDIATKADLDRHHQWLKERFAQRQANYKVLDGSVPAAAGPILIRFTNARPPAGHLYAPQWVAVFADNTFTAAANVQATLCIGTAPLLGRQPPPGDVVLPGITLPTVTSIPDSVLCRGGQEIYLVLGGSGLPGSLITLQATIGALVAEDSPTTIGWI